MNHVRKVDCPDCNGRGHHVCRVCEGVHEYWRETLYLEDFGTDEATETCMNCDEYGNVPCFTCEGECQLWETATEYFTKAEYSAFVRSSLQVIEGGANARSNS